VSEPSQAPERTADNTDAIVRGLLENGSARVVVVTATNTVRDIVTRHAIAGIPAVALGRGALCGLLLATLTKDEEQVTLQVLGNGPLRGVTVDARSSGRVRGFVKQPDSTTWDKAMAAAPRLAIGEAIGREGLVGVTRDLGMAKNYSGQIALSSGEIDEEVDRYLNVSEQIDSVLHCDVVVDEQGAVIAAAGLLVQTLPQAHGAALVEFIRDTLRGPVFSAALREAHAQGKVEAEWIARAALGGCADGMHLLDKRPVSFHCPCSRERAASTLNMLRAEDLEEMILETNEAEVRCNFCGALYRFSEVELETIRREKADSAIQN
jgi:molecular chaperone Hsp33